MFKQPFQTEDLKSALENALGFKIVSFGRIGGGGAVNFKAVREGDGLTFVVKCFPPERKTGCEHLAATLKIVEGAKVPVRLFAEKCPAEFAGHSLLCLEWAEGETIDPCAFSDEQWEAFLDDYRSLFDRMQSVKTDDAIPSGRGLWNDAMAACRGLSGWMVRPILERMNPDEVDYRPESLRTVHGDFHSGNILVRDGKVSCFMDFESLRKGYAVEDLCTLLMIIARKMKSDRKAKLGRIVEFFRRIARRRLVSLREWRTALNVMYLKRYSRKTDGYRRIGFMTALQMAKKAKLNDFIMRQIEAEMSGGEKR